MKGRWKDTAGQPWSVDVDRHFGDAGERRTAADVEEVRSVEIDDARRLLRAVVVHDPLDAAATAADDDERPTRQAHCGRAVVVERRLPPKRVARRLADRSRP